LPNLTPKDSLSILYYIFLNHKTLTSSSTQHQFTNPMQQILDFYM